MRSRSTAVLRVPPVTLDYANLRFSADYVAPFRQTLSAAFGGAGVVFLNGAAGNINPARFPTSSARTSTSRRRSRYPVNWGGFAEADRLGRTLAGEALQAAERALPVEGETISGALPVRLPLKRPEQLAEFLDFMSFRESYRARLMGSDELETEVQVLRIGDVALLALPGEPFVELGLELKRRSKDAGPLLSALRTTTSATS